MGVPYYIICIICSHDVFTLLSLSIMQLHLLCRTRIVAKENIPMSNMRDSSEARDVVDTDIG